MYIQSESLWRAACPDSAEAGAEGPDDEVAECAEGVHEVPKKKRWQLLVLPSLVAGTLLGCWAGVGKSGAEFSVQRGNEDATVRLLVLGDFGRCGQFQGTVVPFRKAKEANREECENQTRLVPALAAAAAAIHAQAVLNVGDAFYSDGLASVSDDYFRGSFMDVYDRDRFPSLDIPWHGIMGNHEHHSANISCHLDPALRERDPRWHAYFEGSLLFPSVDRPLVEVVLLDTTPFAEKYLNQAGAKPGDTCEHRFSEQRKLGATPSNPASWQIELRRQLDLLEQRLVAARNRGVPWLVVMGHNPIRSNGDHGDEASLVALLDPLLWEYGVAAYINGHDHHMEHQEWTRCCEFRRSLHTAAGGPVVINEAVDNDHGEWIELYNSGDVAVSLAGWVLRTDSGYPDRKVDEEQMSLGPGEFLKVDCEVKDGSDSVRLVDANGVLVSEISWGFGLMSNGFSVGRYPDGQGTSGQPMPMTPGAQNAVPHQGGPWLPEGAPASMNVSGWLPAADSRFQARRPGWLRQRMHYLTVGNGAGLGHHASPAEAEESGGGAPRFFRRENGFASLEASKDALVFKFFDAAGLVAHKVRIPRQVS